MKVSTMNSGNGTLGEVPITGGVLNVSIALIHVDEIEIEENYGFEGEQEGEHNDGDEENDQNEDEDGEIELSGPFTLDVSDGEAFIDTVHVYPGVFTKVELEFSTATEEPFIGSSIIIGGDFMPTDGTNIPFSLISVFTEEIEASLAQGTIDVQAEETISLTIVFDLVKWFAGMNFSAAEITEGQILINSQNNADLLTVFENNLGKNIEVEEEEDNDD
jgi:hypothetical protein